MFLGVGFKHFLFFTPTWGDDPIWLIFWGWNHQLDLKKGGESLHARLLLAETSSVGLAGDGEHGVIFESANSGKRTALVILTG